jgi:hypothetical protein
MVQLPPAYVFVQRGGILLNLLAAVRNRAVPSIKNIAPLSRFDHNRASFNDMNDRLFPQYGLRIFSSGLSLIDETCVIVNGVRFKKHSGP